jgi:hypothetical protein
MCIERVKRICDVGKTTGCRVVIIGFPSNPEFLKILLAFIAIGKRQLYALLRQAFADGNPRD